MRKKAKKELYSPVKFGRLAASPPCGGPSALRGLVFIQLLPEHSFSRLSGLLPHPQKAYETLNGGPSASEELGVLARRNSDLCRAAETTPSRDLQNRASLAHDQPPRLLSWGSRCCLGQSCQSTLLFRPRQSGLWLSPCRTGPPSRSGPCQNARRASHLHRVLRRNSQGELLHGKFPIFRGELQVHPEESSAENYMFTRRTTSSPAQTE